MNEKTRGSSKEISASDLAAAIDEFSYEYDPYGYRDAIDDREVAKDALTDSIKRGNASYIKDWLLSVVNEHDGNSARAQQLLDQYVRFTAQGLENRFLSNPDDAFAIYQLKDGDELHDIRFEPMRWLKSIGRSVERENYNLIYTAPLTETGSTSEKLDALWYRFNNERPADFYGHSLSVSDIVVLKQDGMVSCHYVDSFGFQELPDFYSGKNPPNRVANEESTEKCEAVMERLAARYVKPERDHTSPSRDAGIER